MTPARGRLAHDRVTAHLQRSPEVIPGISDFADCANLITFAHQLAGEATRALQRLASDAALHESRGVTVPDPREVAEMLHMSPLDYLQLIAPTQPEETQ